MIQNPMQILQQFNQFKASFKGDPKEEVQKLLSSGRISQAQLDELQQMANELMRFMK